MHEQIPSNFTGSSLIIRYTDSSGHLLRLFMEKQEDAQGTPGPQAEDNARTARTALQSPLKALQDAEEQEDSHSAGMQQEAPKGAARRICTFARAGEEICTELYLGKTKRFHDGIYDNTDGSLIPLGTNPRLAGLMCGTGYSQSQDDLVEAGHFRREDFGEYDGLRYTKLKGLSRDREVRFCLGDEEQPEGVAMRVPPRREGTVQDIICEVRARGMQGYMDYLRLQDRCPQYTLICRLGPGYIVLGDMAHNISVHLDQKDTIIRYPGVRQRVGLCAVLEQDLYARLPRLRQKYAVCISPDGLDLHLYSHIYARMKSFRCINETKQEYNRRL